MARVPKVWSRKGRGFYTTLHRKQRFLAHNKAEAKRELARLLKLPQNIPGQFSTTQLVDIYLTDCQRRVAAEELSPATYATIKSYISRWKESASGFKPEDIRVFHLDLWIENQSTWNPSTRSLAIDQVKRWARWCKRKGYLEYNHLSDAESPSKLKREPADPADLLSLERAIGCDRFRDWYVVLYDTGCRPGELRRITAADVSLATSTTWVRGKTGRRIVGLSERCCAILERLSAIYPTGPLLLTPMGAEWVAESCRYHWDKWCATVWRERPKEMTPYSARHSLWTRWHDAGINDITIAHQLGHTSGGRPHLKLLAGTYAHVEGRHLADAARLASASPGKRKRS